MVYMQHRKEKGFALALTLFLIVILATVCFGALNVTTLDARTAVEDYRASRAFYAARAGIAYAKAQLSDRASQTHVLNYKNINLPLPNGQKSEESFSVIVTPATDNATRDFRIWKVESTGFFEQASRQLIAFVEHETFAKFGYFTDVETNSNEIIRFGANDKLTGAVHTNGFFTMAGHPLFGGMVSSANRNDTAYKNGTYTRTDGVKTKDNKEFFHADNKDYSAEGPAALDDSPDFAFAGGQALIKMPTSTSADIKDAASGNNASVKGDYRIVFTKEGKAKFYKRTKSGNTYKYEGYPDANGRNDKPERIIDTKVRPGVCIFVEGESEIFGDVKGRVTFASTGNILLKDDVQYVNDNDDVLGILGEKSIIIDTNKTTKRDFYLDAIVMALNGSFTVKDYNSGIYRGQLHLFGGVVQNMRGPVATGNSTVNKVKIGSHIEETIDKFGKKTTKVVDDYKTEIVYNFVTGYAKDYVYDPKLETLPPLNFPDTGKYHLRYVIDKGSLGGF